MVAEDADLIPKLLIVSHNRTRFAERTQVFPRIETETADIAERTRRMPAIGGAMSLGSILDDEKTVSACQLKNWIHVGHLTE